MIHALNMVWNPAEGIDLGIFMLRFYSLSWVLAFGLGWYVMKPIFLRENESVESLDKLFVYTLVATMLGARLGHANDGEIDFMLSVAQISFDLFKNGVKEIGRAHV